MLYMKLRYLILVTATLAVVQMHAQNDVGQKDIEIEENQIENLIENLENDGELDFNTLYEDLEFYLEKPLDINKADDITLKESRLFNDIQIADLQNHKLQFGDLLSVHELQTIPSFDLKTIKALEPFVAVSGGLYDYNLGLGQMLKESKSELYLKWRRSLEEQKGYEEDRENGFEGDPNKLYIRYKLYHENRFRITFLAEKDAGESLFNKSNPQGFDFYSGHIHLKEYSRTIKDIIIGDYNVSFGQGLVLHNGFGSNKSSYVMDIKKGGRKLKSYSSVNEINFNRGLATTLQIAPQLELTLFASSKKIDAGTIEDAIDIESGLENFSSFRLDGFHRTPSEIEKEGNLLQQSAGASLSYYKKAFNVGFNVLYNQFDKSLVRDDEPYNLYRFEGDRLLNTSIDYTYKWQNLHFFGETARSDNGGMATLNGLLIGMDRKIDVSFLYRNLAKDYQVLNGNAFGETFGASNEQGFYTGLIIRPFKSLTISSYFDLWNHPWLRFSQDAPSSGKEFLINVNYYKKRKFNLYVQYKYETKQQNSPIDFRIDKLSFFDIHRVRLHFDHSLSKTLRLRNRIEYAHHNEIGKSSTGYLIFQDIIYKPIESPISFTARYALFDTYDSDSRIYAFENDLIYEFYIPQFNGRGRRYYINLRYDLSSAVTFEFRYAQTYLDFKRETDGSIENPLSFGSGNTEIISPKQTDLKAQIRFRF